MKIALIGYGKMGKTIEKIAKARGHQIVSIIDIDNQQDFQSQAFKSAEAAIEFSRPDVATSNIKKCFDAGVPVVVGTTGWTSQMEEMKALMKEKNGTLFWSSNYSIGVNIFSAVNKYLAKIMNQFTDYDVRMSETHHIHKLDAPSGTAITLAEGVIQNLDRKTSWVKGKQTAADGTISGTNDCEASQLPIESIREGEVPGIHTIEYEGPADYITITHNAKSREGFALGAVLAAEFVTGKKGYYGIDDLFTFLK